jgi:hypothetical protein
VLPAPQPTVFKHVLRLTQNEGEMLVDYDSYPERVTMIDSLDERKGRTAQWYERELQLVPAGGILYVAWTRPTTTLAEHRNCTVVVYSPSGREREQFSPSVQQIRQYVTPQGQTLYEYGSTDYLSKPVRNGSRVEVIDRTTGQHFWFLLRLP